MPLHRHHHHHHHSNFLAQLLQLFSHTLVCFLDITVQLHYLPDYLDLGHEEVTRNRQNKYIITFYRKKNPVRLLPSKRTVINLHSIWQTRSITCKQCLQKQGKKSQKCFAKKPATCQVSTTRKFAFCQLSFLIWYRNLAFKLFKNMEIKSCSKTIGCIRHINKSSIFLKVADFLCSMNRYSFKLTEQVR